MLRDAAHSCAIEVDDQGSLLTVTLTNDLVGTDLRFGRQEIQFQPDQHTHALGTANFNLILNLYKERCKSAAAQTLIDGIN